MPFLNDVVRKPSEIRTQIAELTESRRSWERRQRDLPPLLRAAEDAERQLRDQIRQLRDEQVRLQSLPREHLGIGRDGVPYPTATADDISRYHGCAYRITELETAYAAWVDAPEALRQGADQFGHAIIWSIRRPSDVVQQMTVAILCHASCSRAIAAAERELAEALRDR